MAHRITLVPLAVALVLGLAACGGEEPGGSPAATSTQPTSASGTQAQLFDPCAGIPENALTTAGLDPATEQAGIGGVKQPGWEICGWKGADYTLGVFSTAGTVAEFERKQGNVDFQDVTIAGRAGRQFRVDDAAKDQMCDVLFAAKQGLLQLTLVTKTAGQSPCDRLVQVGEAIVPVLPT
ncbi:DUF3558 domain-containing protein [Nocardia sp. NBC_00508]|uniref:DUF3558 domain-containing protein n=1 Tax=Nocardia sp. NBC_00508 TaxID=2975992 RepID=UPI002E800C58|nr:DUF3558 domain-containing protein [Nocardia sp. NBC_00508]WUD67444.1 DUF3558 domain-containing protein [Nocardia sp. NBC_00508]